MNVCEDKTSSMSNSQHKCLTNVTRTFIQLQMDLICIYYRGSAHQQKNSPEKRRPSVSCTERWLRLFLLDVDVCLPLTNTWPRHWPRGCGCWKWVQLWSRRSRSCTSALPRCQQRTADRLLWGRWRSQPYPAAPLCPKRKEGPSWEEKMFQSLYKFIYIIGAQTVTHFRLLKLSAQHTAKVPHPDPTSRFPLFSILRMLTPCTEQNESHLAGST